jgi:signal transduction histidine kinase
VNDRRVSVLTLIGWRMVVVSLVFMGLLIAWMHLRLERAVDALRNQKVEAEARDLARYVAVGAEGALALAVESGSGAPKLPRYYALIDAAGQIVASSLDPPRPLAPLARSDRIDEEWPQQMVPEISHFDTGPDGIARRVNGVTLDLPTRAGPAHLQVAEDRVAGDRLLDDLVNEFFVSVGWLLIPGLALLLLVNLLTIWAAFAPMRAASLMMAGIGPKATGLRLPEENLPKEIYPLIRAVNLALDRLDQGFKAQRAFTADAAHELRTPLAVLRAHIDALPDRKAAEALRRDLDPMARLVSQLLKIAQLETLAVDVEERADLHAVAVEAASLLAPLAVNAGKSIAVTGVAGSVMVWGNEDALGQAARNLIENALAHTPPGTTVEVEVDAAPALKVRDHGPGVEPTVRTRVFQRFWRGDKRTGDGAGLGLAIVARIAEAHGGSVAVDDAPGGGALFTLRLCREKPTS